MAMRPIFRLVGALLVGMTSLIALGAPLYALPSRHPVQPAGCHSHGAPAGDRAPVSYQCCATGHNIGIPLSEFTVHPLAVVGEAQAGKPAFPAGAMPVTSFMLHPRLDSSPGFDSLRI